VANGKLAGKVAIITGGNSGIGRASARLFAHEGAKVTIGARNEQTGASIVQMIKDEGRGDALFVKTDVSQPEDVENLVKSCIERFGRLDILYGNSGIFPPGTAPDTPIETWRNTIYTNLGGQFYLAKYGIPELIKFGGDSIIFTASELGTVGVKEGVAYCASKGGLINMTRAIAIDCAVHNIRVNCLAPGPVETPMKRAWLNQAENPRELEDAQIKPVLLKRFGTPEEIAEVAVFLASDASSFMTGAILIVDGGATSWYGL
jgi:NAD(P)-dependent dehydrogenase (short-subunit alcohol dehydrogenase family)